MQRDKLKNSNTSQTTESDSSNCNIQEALKKNQNLKSSYLLYFMGKKSWNLKCKFRYGFFIALSKKKQCFFISSQKGILRPKDQLLY